MPVLAPEQWPECIRGIPEIAGVFVGGCVERGDGSRFRAKAHVHTGEGDAHRGWICVLAARRLGERALMLHEAAHAVACFRGSRGHDDRWRAVLLAMGGTLDEVPGLMRSYQKKTRARATTTASPSEKGG